MARQTPAFFEFEGLRFHPDDASIVRLRDGSKSSIRPKEQQLLTLLLKRKGEIVTYEELWTTLWPDIKNLDAARRTMTETRSTLDRLLREILKSDISIIQTIARVGYRIDVPVVSPSARETRDESSIVKRFSDVGGLSSPLKLPRAHVLGSCALYSSAFVCVLLLEVAYNSDRYWVRALEISPTIFLWVFLTSLSALIFDWRRTVRQSANTLPVVALVFIASAFFVCGALVTFLPQTPVTEATFQTQTAQAAYLKNIGLYFLPLATVFLLIPLHFIASLNREVALNNFRTVRELLIGKRRAISLPNAIYLKPRTLGSLLVIAAIVSLPSTYWLLDHLKSGPYMNRFMLLVMCREILYFGLGAESLIWYSKAINEIKSKATGADSQS